MIDIERTAWELSIHALWPLFGPTIFIAIGFLVMWIVNGGDQ